MRWTTDSLIALATVGLLACGGEKPPPQMALDSSRLSDSIIPIVDAPLPDTSALVPPPPEPVATPRPQPTPKPAPPKAVVAAPPSAAQPAPPPAAEVLPTPVPTLAAGVVIATTTLDSIHSHLNKVGDSIRVRVAADVPDASGKVVIPAGAIVTLHIVQIAEASNRGEKGTLVLSATDVEIDGVSYPVVARASDYAYEMKARPIGAGEVAKTGIGAAAGAIIGHAIGGKTGTVVGAVGGGAAGAAVAAKSANRDIIVHAGNSVTLTLRDAFVRKP